MGSSLSRGARSTRCLCQHNPGYLRWGSHFSIPRGRALVLSPEVGPSLPKSRGRALVFSPEVTQSRGRALVLSPEGAPSFKKSRGRALVLSSEERSSLNNHYQACLGL